MAMDLTGRVFGKLTVIERDKDDYIYPATGMHEPRWVCECNCEEHKRTTVIQHNLINGHCHSCGCDNKNKFIDLTGKVFGKLTVIERAADEIDKNGNKKIMWRCVCSCPEHKIVTIEGHALKTGHTKSCGCAVKEAVTKHGCSGTSISSHYYDMINRCYSPSAWCYDRYGGRGITVCDEWLDKDNGLKNFRDFMVSHGYVENVGLSIDRIDNNGPYAPWNCRIADAKMQANNRSSNVNITYNGETHTISEWADIAGIDYFTFRNRVSVLGWDMEKALTTPINTPAVYTSSTGESHTVTEWATILGINQGAVKDRLAAGWSIDKIITTPVKVANEITYNGYSYSCSGWDRRLGFCHGTIAKRIRKGASIEEAITTPTKNTVTNEITLPSAIYFEDDNGKIYGQEEWEKLHPSND